jgi:hypothetical protein
MNDLKFADELTAEEAKAILAIRNGVDVYSYALAQTLRGMQRRGLSVADFKASGRRNAHLEPELRLFDITEPQAYEGDGTDQVPYFGAIATPWGAKVARAALAKAAP